MPAKPKPDEYGRIRVIDEETGHEFNVTEAGFAHGKYKVADGPASDLNGDALPPLHRSLSSKSSTSGQSADKKE